MLWLIKKGADPHAKNNKGSNALKFYLGNYGGCFLQMKVLIDCYYNINDTFYKDYTPLQYVDRYIGLAEDPDDKFYLKEGEIRREKDLKHFKMCKKML